MKYFATQNVVMFAGLLAVPVVTAVDRPTPTATPQQGDPRLPVLKAFFDRYGCPVSAYSVEFLIAADENDLDWRLLPSISLIESGGGKQSKKNNIFGWQSAKGEFPSVRVAIRTVASRLANSKLYKDKDLDGILNTYNHEPEYPYRVKSVMRRLGSADMGPNTALN
jgi:hypothetical protein